MPVLAAAAMLCAQGNAQVSLRESTYDWKTWDIAERADHGVTGQNLTRTVTRHFKTLILENEFLTVTLLPEYGGRILSIVYKPTGREQLFQNPVGFADGIGAGNFYYNWLMVLGGIFPTFPEPEHGKTYLLPWKSETVANTPQRVSVAMSIQDNVDFSGRPSRFVYGVTGLTCIATVTLDAGKSSLELKIQLKNDRAQTVRYEYWTCHSLAPGSVPGDTKSPRSTEIVVPIERYSTGFGTGGIDQTLPGGQEYKNLAFFRNWKVPGIAYAEPAVTRKWWGVLNHDNGEGIFRIADDPKQTPGLKFWTWGYKDSYPLAAPARQFIELWAGASHQFFSPAQIAANSSKTWTETYIPTVGLKAVSFANEYALVSLRTDKTAYDGLAEKSFTVSADISTAAPGSPYRARVAGGPGGARILLDTLILPNPKDAARLTLTRPLSDIGSGKQALMLRLEDAKGAVLLETETPITVANVSIASRPRAIALPSGYALRILDEGDLEFRFPDPSPREVRIYDVRRRLVLRRSFSGASAHRIPASEIPEGAGPLGVRVHGAAGTFWIPAHRRD
jgi:hypothetical protein